jgi:uncharacterized protein (TIGR03435 family)
MRRKNAWKLPLAGIAFAILLAAQKPPGSAEFEVVSIKPADPAAPAHMAQQTPAGFRGRNLRLFELIMNAWHLNRDQIVGGPKWLETAGWDIDARFPDAAGSAQFPQMLQAMLADRFRLVIHGETRTLPVYALILAKGGFRLHKGNDRGGMSAGPRRIRYDAVTMAELAGQLSSYLGRNVIHRTGITGQYAISLSFAPVDLGAPQGDDTQEPAPSIFQALTGPGGTEALVVTIVRSIHLELWYPPKLEPVNAPVEILVIDHAEKPTPN